MKMARLAYCSAITVSVCKNSLPSSFITIVKIQSSPSKITLIIFVKVKKLYFLKTLVIFNV